MAESYPVEMDLILLAENQDDKRDHLLKTFAKECRQALKYLNRKECLNSGKNPLSLLVKTWSYRAYKIETSCATLCFTYTKTVI